jgi:outer membrane protein OmpA-like peptidoglycan-associated protein
MTKAWFGVPVLAVAIVGSGCATKGFVKQSVATVDEKVDSLSKSVEETQQRTKDDEGKINDVDQKTQAAQTSANQANQAASTADQHAQAANDAASSANAKADALDKASRKLVYEVVLNDSEGNFKFAKSDLPDSAKTKIDDMVNQILANPQDVYFEIEGYTDSTGSKDYNKQLGLDRADAVKMYLYTQYHIPLHKMNVISYGADNPVAPNTTKEGRAQNRRVVIKVLA